MRIFSFIANAIDDRTGSVEGHRVRNLNGADAPEDLD
jgi:hypothetical protein